MGDGTGGTTRGAGGTGTGQVRLADPAAIEEAARLLRSGGLVAFPTETVYGHGALAERDEYVARIFVAKGRPSHNPVIVHVEGAEDARRLSLGFVDAAEALAARFWPGPLTMVLARGESIPDRVTAGGGTVALRAPAHPVARALLRAVGAPLAAPSANRSSELSPTTAEHVRVSLGDRVEMILDGGPCPLGIESTVVDLTGAELVVLRPGVIGRAELRACLRGLLEIRERPPEAAGPARSPGQLARHYAPRTPLELVAGRQMAARVFRLTRDGERVHVLGCGRRWAVGAELPRDPARYATGLYATLHMLDGGADRILVEVPPDDEAWEAVHDRLRRAAEKR